MHQKKFKEENIQTKNKNFIEINDLTFGYNLKQNIFENLNLKISKVKKFVLLVRQVLKTILFHLMLGLLHPKKVLLHIMEKVLLTILIIGIKNWLYIPKYLHLDNQLKKYHLNYNNEIIDEKLLNESVSFQI